MCQFNNTSKATAKWCVLISFNKQQNILFIARSIDPHREKILSQIIKEKLNLVILCSTKNHFDKKYQPYLHPYFTAIANYTFTNWTLIFIAPILVFLDTLLFKRTKVIGVNTATFGWATSFAVNCKKIIFALGGDLLVGPYRNFLKKITVKMALRRCNLLFVDNYQGIRNAYSLGFKGVAEFSPYGVEIPTLKSSFNERIRLHGETILWVRGTNPVYNIDCFLMALKELKNKNRTNWKVIFAGKGTSSSSFRSKIKKYNLEKQAQLKGFITKKSEMAELYSKATIFVSSSLSDGTSVALLEGMVYGLTMIVSDFKNNSFWIKNQKNGFLFDSKNPEDLAAILDKILRGSISIDDRKAMNVLSQKFVKKHGSLEIFNKKVSEMLQLNCS